MTSSITESVRDFLKDRVRGAENVSGDENLFELGLVNSLFAMQLVNFVEKEFGVVVEDDDLTIEHFQSINAIADLVARKTEAAS